MTEAESIGTARIDVTLNTSTMEVGAEAAKRKVAGLGTEAAAQFDKANASTKRYAESLSRQAELLGKSRAEQIAYNAQTRIGGELGDQIAKKALANQAALTKANEKFVLSDAARAAAMRNVPAQVTDIVTGLATGQKPLQVLLQQGGQLKDMFGGVGAAAKALGSSLLGVVNPATLLAGAAIALFAAWHGGEQEQVAYAKALATTGNYAAQTTGQLQALAVDLGGVNGRQHEAAAVLAQVAGSGKFTADQLRLVASAAFAAGDGADEVVQQFAKLADDPVSAAVELNKTYHFLTAAVYEQISALEDEGRTQDAAKLAMETYSAAVVSRAAEVKANLGLLERSWAGVTGAAKRAWDAMMDVGRPQTDQAKFDVLFQNRDAAKKLIDRGMGSASFYGKTAQQFYDDATKQLGSMQDAQVAAQKKASRDAASQQANDAAIALAQEAQRYATDEAKRTQRIAAIHQQANDAIAQATLAGNKEPVAKIRASETAAVAGVMAQGPKPKAEKDLTIDVADGWKDMIAQIERGISADKKEIEQRARATTELNSYREAMQQRLQTDRQALEIQVQSLGMGQHQIDIQRQLIDIQRDADRELARLNDPANRRTLTDDEYQQRLGAIKDYEDQRVQLVYDADARLEAARSDWANGARRAMADITYDASDTATNFANLVQGTYGSLSDFIVDAATTGKASVKDLVSSILKEVARLQANKAAASLLNYGISYFTGGYGGTNGQGGVDYNSQGFVSKVYAKGGVVDGASLSNWSNTIVDRPTTFAFARGAGLMGEAGPEAIMPLTRTADGKLGVRQVGASDGASVNVSVVVNADGSGGTDAEGDYQAWGKQLGENMRSIAQKELANAMRPGGVLWRASAGR